MSLKTGKRLNKSPLYMRNSMFSTTRVIVPSSNQNCLSLVMVGSGAGGWSEGVELSSSRGRFWTSEGVEDMVGVRESKGVKET